MTSVVERTQCPQCKQFGHDTHQDNLVTYEDGGQHCFACGYHTGEGHPEDVMSLPPVQPTHLKPKGISTGTCSKYRVGYSERDWTYYFPLYDRKQRLCASKSRTHDSFQGKTSDKYRWVKGSDAKRSLMFGSHLFDYTKKVVLCTGETDALSVAEACPDMCVLGATKGEQGWAQQIREFSEELSRCRYITVCLDNDKAGLAVKDQVLAALPKTAAIKVLIPPAGYKDCGDLLKDGKLARAIRHARPITPAGIKDLQERRDEAIAFYTKSNFRTGITTGFDGFDYLSGGYVPGKLLIGTGDTGIGKTRWLQYLAFCAAQRGVPTLFVPLEMTTVQVDLQLCELVLQRQLLGAEDNNYIVPTNKLSNAHQIATYNIHQADHFGRMDVREFERRVMVAVNQYDVQLVVLDHLTAFCTDTKGLDWGVVDGTLAALKKIAIDHGVCLLTVSHVNSPENSKSKELRIVNLHEMRGGRSIEQYADCVFGMSRNQGSNEMYLYTLKQDRFAGRYVAPLALGYEYKNYRYTEFSTSAAGPGLKRRVNAYGKTKESSQGIRLPLRVQDSSTESEANQEHIPF